MSRARSRNAVSLSAKRLRVGVVVSRFNPAIGRRLSAGAERRLRQLGAKRIETVAVPGAFELPLACQRLARSGRYDALVAVGAVVRGDTPHFDYVAGACAHGLLEVMLQESIPIGFGVLTTETARQALERAGGRHGNKGAEAAEVAVEMARLVVGSKRRK